jgi:hypothetical protein
MMFHHVVTKGGDHWIVRESDDGRYYRLSAFHAEGEADEYLRSMRGEYDLEQAILDALPDAMKQNPRGVRPSIHLCRDVQSEGAESSGGLLPDDE